MNKNRTMVLICFINIKMKIKINNQKHMLVCLITLLKATLQGKIYTNRKYLKNIYKIWRIEIRVAYKRLNNRIKRNNNNNNKIMKIINIMKINGFVACSMKKMSTTKSFKTKKVNNNIGSTLKHNKWTKNCRTLLKNLKTRRRKLTFKNG